MKRCIAFYEDDVFKFLWLKMADDILDFTDYNEVMGAGRVNNILLITLFGLSSFVLWNV